MKILIAEDDRVSRRILSKYLEKWGYQVVVAEDGDQAWEILDSEEAPSLVILDWEMPGRDGVDICRAVREVDREPYSYILLLTARKDQEDIINGLQAGADDYITKPFDKHELEVRLRAGKRIIELQEELIEARETLRIMALHDPLTGLFNRGAILDKLNSELSRARRSSEPVALILGDIDHFKQINDNHGHPAGDEVLRRISARLRESSRSYDSVGRYGGEEFLVVVPGCGPQDAIKQARRLHRTIRDEPVKCQEHRLPVTMSMGLTVYDGASEPDIEQLVHDADDALYRAKRRGRDRIEYGDLLSDFSPESREPAQSRKKRASTARDQAQRAT
ncbi:MAG TPA: diguanylate cyclase [Acidobacteriota bacterium]|nr:diguanylate cyclase [Acidobacteriota bacterium]